MPAQQKVNVYTRYPLSSVFIYNGVTILHYAAGGLYFLFAVVQMYVIMPLSVCSNCVYYRMKNARCISVLFPKIACLYCCAKKECPNAQQMGIGGEG
ncbi:MAG: hypothetical protein GY950_08595 [bacterium]|nr:hypothetical protein [bacterium]